jgi:alpha-1,3-rhamnosyltransferase
MNLDKPLVSVIVPSYNHQQFITQCIESIMDQTYKNFELTVIDDGSTDDSPEILKRLKEKYKFNLVFQENIGLALTLNKGIQNYCNGKYYSSCSSDDFWPIDKLEKQVNFMELHPEFPMCFGKKYVIDSNGKIQEYLTSLANKHLKGGRVFKEIILMEFHPPVNYFFRKSIFEEVGYYTNTWAEDFYMNLKISEKYPLGYIDDYLMYYRITDNEKSKMINLKSITSHLDSINQYRYSEYYEEAIKRWYLRSFYWYSKFTKTKKIAFKGMLRNLDQAYKFYFLKSVFKLMIMWK